MSKTKTKKKKKAAKAAAPVPGPAFPRTPGKLICDTGISLSWIRMNHDTLRILMIYQGKPVVALVPQNDVNEDLLDEVHALALIVARGNHDQIRDVLGKDLGTHIIDLMTVVVKKPTKAKPEGAGDYPEDEDEEI